MTKGRQALERSRGACGPTPRRRLVVAVFVTAAVAGAVTFVVRTAPRDARLDVQRAEASDGSFEAAAANDPQAASAALAPLMSAPFDETRIPQPGVGGRSVIIGVVDDDGAPVAGLTLVGRRRRNGAASDDVVTTDASGRATFSNVVGAFEVGLADELVDGRLRPPSAALVGGTRPPAFVEIPALGGRRLAARSTWVCAAPGSFQRLIYRRFPVVRGRVVAPDGAAVGGARVSLIARFDDGVEASVSYRDHAESASRRRLDPGDPPRQRGGGRGSTVRDLAEAETATDGRFEVRLAWGLEVAVDAPIRSLAVELAPTEGLGRRIPLEGVPKADVDLGDVVAPASRWAKLLAVGPDGTPLDASVAEGFEHVGRRPSVSSTGAMLRVDDAGPRLRIVADGSESVDLPTPVGGSYASPETVTIRLQPIAKASVVLTAAALTGACAVAIGYGDAPPVRARFCEVPDEFVNDAVLDPFRPTARIDDLPAGVPLKVFAFHDVGVHATCFDAAPAATPVAPLAPGEVRTVDIAVPPPATWLTVRFRGAEEALAKHRTLTLRLVRAADGASAARTVHDAELKDGAVRLLAPPGALRLVATCGDAWGEAHADVSGPESPVEVALRPGRRVTLNVLPVRGALCTEPVVSPPDDAAVAAERGALPLRLIARPDGSAASWTTSVVAPRDREVRFEIAAFGGRGVCVVPPGVDEAVYAPDACGLVHITLNPTPVRRDGTLRVRSEAGDWSWSLLWERRPGEETRLAPMPLVPGAYRATWSDRLGPPQEVEFVVSPGADPVVAL